MPGTVYAAPSVGNYTFGAHSLAINPTPKSLGNIVTAAVTVTLDNLEHYSALHGQNMPDASMVKRHMITIKATLDEPNKDNMFLFFGCDSGGVVGKTPQLITNIAFAGIAIQGNSFTWAIPKAVIRPSGDFSFDDQDWTKFSLDIRLLFNSATPTAPYGTLVHDGSNV